MNLLWGYKMKMKSPDMLGKRKVSQVPYWVIAIKKAGVNIIPNVFNRKQDAVDFLRALQASWVTQGSKEKVQHYYEIVRM